jgi:transposase
VTNRYRSPPCPSRCLPIGLTRLKAPLPNRPLAKWGRIWVVRSAERQAHPRFHVHFTPTSSSWLNLVERWFAEITNKWIRRGTHRSVKEFASSITHWVGTWNENPRPYV